MSFLGLWWLVKCWMRFSLFKTALYARLALGLPRRLPGFKAPSDSSRLLCELWWMYQNHCDSSVEPWEMGSSAISNSHYWGPGYRQPSPGMGWVYFRSVTIGKSSSYSHFKWSTGSAHMMTVNILSSFPVMVCMFVSVCICLSTDPSKKALLYRNLLLGSRKTLNLDACQPLRLPRSEDPHPTSSLVQESIFEDFFFTTP